ncbi:MAG TPA: aspartate aminotransferase family protein [Candidatus Caldiarchaeum subterraneum]|uniref:Aspartate aminotransferase family protein n=1 Tax=Caldiarchaeum subterraneum TaxID=311458 RepID=A0A832ZVJ8_CALS0|nr:aspartate aminotransferase family protein [Hydrogenothermaceae bacterium]HIQ29694.1 aspartate aminotransferase family protein [Candidatus Caldarchaeum subterraneum]
MSSDSYYEEFSAKTRGSAELYGKAVNLTPYGVHSNWRIFEPYPLFMKRGRGSRIWDVDGNEYIDYNMAFGALGIGHSHPVLVEEMKRVIEDGTIFGFEAENSVKVAEVLTSRYGYDMVRFSTTGLEATLLAVRLARAFTGRKKILKFEGCFHGTHEPLMVSVKPSVYRAGHVKTPNPVPASLGMPEEFTNLVIAAPYGDLEATEKIMQRQGNEVAGIILEPIAMNMGVVIPSLGFLRGLRDLADEYNCVLIFDEVKTSGKFYRGVQEWCGVRGDIMVVAKSIAGGYPFSAVLSRREIFEVVGPNKTAHGGTFNSNPLSVTASYITLTKILTEENLKHSQQLSRELAKGYDDILSDAGLEYNISHIATSGTIYFTSRKINNWREFVKYNNFGRWYAWVMAMLRRGIIPQALGYDEQWTVSIQHSREDIDKTLEAMKEAVKEIKDISKQLAVEEVL